MAPLPKQVRQRLTQEFRYASQKMDEATDLPTKLYFFSVFFGEANRSLNLAWDDDLALLHMVCQTAYEHMNQRIQLMASGADRVVGIPKDLPWALSEIARSLALLFEVPETDKQKLERVLSRLAAVTYTTTGNGAYLYNKGQIKISPSSENEHPS